MPACEKRTSRRGGGNVERKYEITQCINGESIVLFTASSMAELCKAYRHFRPDSPWYQDKPYIRMRICGNILPIYKAEELAMKQHREMD